MDFEPDEAPTDTKFEADPAERRHSLAERYRDAQRRSEPLKARRLEGGG